MPLVKIKPGLSHAHYSAGDVFDASPAEMVSFGDKFILVIESPVDELGPVKAISWTEVVESPVDKPEPVKVISWTEVVATPAARRLAQEHSISPNIVGTGRRGSIIKADVQAILDSDDGPALNDDDTKASLEAIEQLMQPDHLASLIGGDVGALSDGDTQ